MPLLKNAVLKQTKSLKMSTIRLFILLMVVCLCSCSEDKKAEQSTAQDTVSTMKVMTESNVVSAAIDTAHHSQNSLDWVGTYQGTLPCDDCDGMETTVILNKDLTYKNLIVYKGKGSGKPVTFEGKFSWADGNSIVLDGITDAPSKYAVGEQTLLQLGMDGKQKNDLPARKYTLKKIIKE